MSIDAQIKYIQDKADRDVIYSRVRPDIISSLLEYALRGRPTGGFLRAVLSNNLRETIARADHENLAVLKEIVTFVYMELPEPCWGSDERVTAWLERFQGQP